MLSPPQSPTSPSFGILVVGLNGANGSVLAAAHNAQQTVSSFRGPQGQLLHPTLDGCITQKIDFGSSSISSSSSVFRGFRHLLSPDPDFSPLSLTNAHVGGWDIRDFSSVGAALEKNQVLDYDLVRQLNQPSQPNQKGRLADLHAMPGVYDKRFISSEMWPEISPNAIDLQAAGTSPTSALEKIRGDIARFKAVTKLAHVTVIFSGSVEPNSSLVEQLSTKEALLGAFGIGEGDGNGNGSGNGSGNGNAMHDHPMPPSLVYATAAVLEGCSFVNGASMNTIQCCGLHDLHDNNSNK